MAFTFTTRKCFLFFSFSRFSNQAFSARGLQQLRQNLLYAKRMINSKLADNRYSPRYTVTVE